MKIMPKAFWMLFLSAFMSWSAAAQTPESASTPALTSISLSQSGCYGRCPSYSVALYANGEVRFNGHAHTALKGEHQKKVDPTLFQALVAQAATLDLRNMHGNFGPHSPYCPTWRTDASGTSISAQYAGAKMPKVISWYSGCVDVKTEFGKPPFELAAEIMRAADVQDWVRSPQPFPFKDLQSPP